MPRAPLQPGDPTRIGAYEILGRIGHGGQGIVYLGRPALVPHADPVAIKLLHARLSEDAGARSRFVREFDAAKKVARFCTAQVLDADVAGDHPYIVSEYVEGRSLRAQILDEGPRHGGALERLAISTLTALAAIHRAGVVHRDFNPLNVLLGPDGPRVIDFGIARALEGVAAEETQSGHVGTPAYMSPEQVTGDPVGPATDLFAWGSTIAFAATGAPPFGKDAIPAVMQRILHDQPDLSVLPEPLRSVVGACLAKDPALRPSAQTAHDRLLGHPTPTPIRSQTTPTSPTRFRWAAVAGAGVVIAVSAVAVAMPQGGGRSAAATRGGSPTPAVVPQRGTPVSGPPTAAGAAAVGHRPRRRPTHSPSPLTGDCRTATRPYGVAGVGTVILHATACRDQVYGGAVTIDTGRATGWYACVQIGGHVVGTPNNAHGTYVAGVVMSAQGGKVHSAKVTAAGHGSFDSGSVDVGRCQVTAGRLTFDRLTYDVLPIS